MEYLHDLKLLKSGLRWSLKYIELNLTSVHRILKLTCKRNVLIWKELLSETSGKSTML